MRKTVIILLIGVFMLGLLSLCIVQHRQIQKLTTENELPKRAVKPPAAVALDGATNVALETQGKQERLIAAAQINDGEAVSPLEAQLAVAKAAPTTGKIAETEATPKTSKNASAPTNESPMSLVVKMMKDPAIKDMMRDMQKGQMDTSYGSLFKYLQLSDADLEAFKGLLLDKQMAPMSGGFDIMTKARTPEEMAAEGKRIKETTAAFDARIKELLGDENYAVYQSFEETQLERMQVTQLKGSLNSGDQMTEEQEDKLIRAMHVERTNFHYSVGVDEKQTADITQFTPERIAKLLEESAKLQEQYVSQAAAILTPTQLEQFKANQKQQQAMQEMGMKMAAKMFEQPSKEASGDSP